MPRTTPTNVDLQFCETHDFARITLRDGTVLRLGTASITIVEEDALLHAYSPSLVVAGGLKQSLTRASDRITFSAQNVDRQLGLAVNDVDKVLTGTKIVFGRAFLQEDGSTQSVADLLVGEIVSVKVDQETVDFEAVSDLAPDLAFISNRAIDTLGAFPQGELGSIIPNPDDFGGIRPGGGFEDGVPRHGYPPRTWYGGTGAVMMMV